jgi:Bacteriophage replication protein O
MADTFFYKGIPSLNGTIVPDDVFDVLMPMCTGAEFKVLAYIVRRTFGFKKESDAISLHQMVDGITKRNGMVLDRGTGLSKSAVAVAIKGLVIKGIIEAHRSTSKKRGYEPTTYRLRFAATQPLSRNRTRGGKKMDKGLSRNRTYKQQEDKQQLSTPLTGLLRGWRRVVCLSYQT